MDELDRARLACDSAPWKALRSEIYMRKHVDGRRKPIKNSRDNSFIVKLYLQCFSRGPCRRQRTKRFQCEATNPTPPYATGVTHLERHAFVSSPKLPPFPLYNAKIKTKRRLIGCSARRRVITNSAGPRRTACALFVHWSIGKHN